MAIIDLFSLGENETDLILARLSQRDAVTLSMVSKKWTAYPRSAVFESADPERLELFLKWVSARIIDSIDVTTHPEAWNRLAPALLDGIHFKNVAIFPNELLLAGVPVWMPACDDVQSGFFQDPVYAQGEPPFLSIQARSRQTTIPHIRLPCACFAFTSRGAREWGTMREPHRIPDAKTVILCWHATVADLRHISTLTKTVAFCVKNETIDDLGTHVFAATSIDTYTKTLPVIASAPMCEQLVLTVERHFNISDLESIPARFPRLVKLRFAGKIDRDDVPAFNAAVARLFP